MGTLHRLASRLATWPIAMLNEAEYTRQRYTRLNERPIELAFLFRHLATLAPKMVLDVGTGDSALPALLRSTGSIVHAVDNVDDYWPHGMVNRHYHVEAQDVTTWQGMVGTYDLVTCISTLEHILEHERAMQGMFNMLRPGGHLVLTCPYTAHIYSPNVYLEPDSAYGQDYPFPTQSFSRSELCRWLVPGHQVLVDAEFWRCWTGEFWTVGQQVVPPVQVLEQQRHQLACFLFRREV